MKNLISFIVLFCLFATSGFSQKEIDMKGAIGNKQEIKLSEIAQSIRYIPLETTEECLLNTDLKVYYGEEYLFVLDEKEPGNFYRFTKEGKFLNKIGQVGEGPKEYIRSLTFMVNEDKQEFIITDFQRGEFVVYSYEGAFIRRMKFPENTFVMNAATLCNGNLVYANNNFYRSNKNYELFLADAQTGKVKERVLSTVPGDYKIRILLTPPLLYTYQGEVYYKNPLKNVICVLRDGLKQYRKYVLNVGAVDNENRDDYFNPQKNKNALDILGIHETDSFLMFFYGYQGDAHWMIFSKQDWAGRVAVCQDKFGFVDDLSGTDQPFAPRSYYSLSNRYLVDIHPDEAGDNNPTIVVAELKGIN